MNQTNRLLADDPSCPKSSDDLQAAELAAKEQQLATKEQQLKEETLAAREQAVALREQAAARAATAAPPEPAASAASPPPSPTPPRRNDGTYACGSVRCGDLQRCCQGARVPCIPKAEFCGDDSQNMWGDTCDLQTNEPCRSGKTCKAVKQGNSPLTVSATCM